MSDSRPDFICIGAQKAATNWLWQNLKGHPDIWMPPIKELHFFDRSPRYPSPSYLSSERLGTRLFGHGQFDKDFRRVFTRRLVLAPFREDWRTFRWFFRHYTGRYNTRWYLSLYEGGAGQVRGEITPSYSILDTWDVRSISRVLPKLKVILMLRNPIDRAWSHVRFDWTTKRFDGIDNIEKVKAFIESPKQRLRSDYLRTIETWGAFYPSEQFFIGFYDDVVQNPRKVLVDVQEFLGIHPLLESAEGKADEKIFASRERSIPVEILHYLIDMYQKDLEKLSDQFGGHATSWLLEAREMLQRNAKR